MNRRSTLSTPYARTKQEMARVSLYSRFLPPKVELSPDSEDASVQSTPLTSKAGSEAPADQCANSSTSIKDAPLKEKRSKAEKAEKKAARHEKKAAKLRKAQEKEEKRARKAAQNAASVARAADNAA